jgi:hypothetical protein
VAIYTLVLDAQLQQPKTTIMLSASSDGDYARGESVLADLAMASCCAPPQSRIVTTTIVVIEIPLAVGAIL